METPIIEKNILEENKLTSNGDNNIKILKQKTKKELLLIAIKTKFKEYKKINYEFFYDENLECDYCSISTNEPDIYYLSTLMEFSYFNRSNYFKVHFADYKYYQSDNRDWFYLTEKEAENVIAEFNKKFNTNIQFDDGEYLSAIVKFDYDDKMRKNAFDEMVRFAHYTDIAYGVKLGYKIPSDILKDYENLYLIKSYQKETNDKEKQKIKAIAIAIAKAKALQLEAEARLRLK